jgi:tetratricopeptide (TPR) repeat protein
VALPFQIVISRRLLVPGLCIVLTALSLPSSAQAPIQTQSSSSSSDQPVPAQDTPKNTAPHLPQVEAGGSAITLETSEPLFDLAVALNACGYDADLANSNPVRLRIRGEVNDALANSAPARDSRDTLCSYIRQHTLTDPGLNLAQYVSLALYVTPAPELTTSVDETEMPPDSTQVINILPLLRTFSDAIHLHAIWIEHRPEYEALVNQVHDPLTHMVLETNIFLHMPVSSYDGRRFLVLLEPMLAPSATNARIYASDYIVVTSPSASGQTDKTNGGVRMDDIRHTYLHYMVEPLVYARAAAMDRLLPLLKPVQNAPLDFAHKSDIVALLTECLIKAVEAQTMDVGIPKPKRANTGNQRLDATRFEAEISAYDHQAEIARRQAVERDMRQGWVLVEYFYDKLGTMERDGISLKDNIGEMVYGMDVEHERHHDEQIAFFPEGSAGSADVVRRVVQPPTGLRLAELKLLEGDIATAQELAEKALTDPAADHPQANYILAQAELMEREPDDAISHFSEAIKTSKDPRTLAWSHIYLGRLYDIQSERPKALDEYKAALATRDGRLDTKAAAETGLKQPFALPKREAVPHATSNDDNAPFDPSGKAEKEAYKPSTTPQP